MQGAFPRFGASHLVALAVFPLLAGGLAWLARRQPALQRPIRLSLAASLLAVELGWFAVLLVHYGVPLKWALPFQLSDAAILLTVVVIFTLHQKLFDVVFYWGLTAVPLAMLMPDILEPFPDPYTIVFFVVHGLVVTVFLYLLWSGTMRPQPGSALRSFLVLNVFMIFVLSFNFAFGTNYMYLMEKPSQPSLLDYFGPWPVYIVFSEFFAILLFGALGLLCAEKRRPGGESQLPGY